MDPATTPQKSPDVKINLQELKDLRVQNISLTKEIGESKIKLEEFEEKTDRLEKENKFLTEKLQKLLVENAEMERSLTITNEADNIK
mmetsp:Transcript_20107/g.19742  ORF Transcript_20107/g.19742 Transcript_20107/m.19742 type:complete len:87 (-) Transcript_20107:785-1045(-)